MSNRMVAAVKMIFLWALTLSLICGSITLIIRVLNGESLALEFTGNIMIFGALMGALAGAGFVYILSRFGQGGTVEALPRRSMVNWGTLLGAIAGFAGFAIMSWRLDGSVMLGPAFWFSVGSAVLGRVTAAAVIAIAKRGKSLPGEANLDELTPSS